MTARGSTPDPVVDLVERTRHRQELGRAAAAAFVASWFACESEAPVLLPATNAPFLVDCWRTTRLPSLDIALTSGLGCVTSPRLPTGTFVELAAITPRLGPLCHVLSVLAHAVHEAPDDAPPLGEWDRLVLQAPVRGLAGAVLKPLGGLSLTSGRQVFIYDLLPLLDDELARFRRHPEAHGAWVDERLHRDDYDALHRRWERLL